MSASRLSSLLISDDDDWGTVSPLPSTSSRAASSVTSTSGEFNAFTAVGSVAGGVPSVCYGFWRKTDLLPA